MQLMIEMSSLSMHNIITHEKHKKKKKGLGLLEKKTKELADTAVFLRSSSKECPNKLPIHNFYRFGILSISFTQIQAQIQDPRNFKNRDQNQTKPLILI